MNTEDSTTIYRPKLSICIATYNRASFLIDTLETILPQLTNFVELLVVDGASPDNTPEIMAEKIIQYPKIKYYREKENSGVDRDYDRAVSYASGEYCWLMTDDDLIFPHAVSRILDAISDGVDLIVVNSEVRDVSLSVILESRLLAEVADKHYSDVDHEAIFSEIGGYLSFIGAVVVRRDFWMGRNRVAYYGTLFIHVGVLFQSPPIRSVKIIAEPLIRIRYGNAMWTARGFEIWMFRWPELIWSFADFSKYSLGKVCSQRPYLHMKKLLLYRALGGYSYEEYSKYLSNSLPDLKAIGPYLIAVCPAVLANFVCSVYCFLNSENTRVGMYGLVRSPHASWATRMFARAMGVLTR